MLGTAGLASGALADTLLTIAVGAGLVAAIGIAVRVFLLANGHTEEAVALLTRISDALILDPLLGRAPVTVTAHSRLWRWSPLTIEVGGHVPTAALREAALALVQREVNAHAGGPFRIEDRMAIAGLRAGSGVDSQVGGS